MNSTLQTLRASASFSAWWHLVPFALSGAVIVLACVVQTLVGTDSDSNAAVETPVAAPMPSDAHGA
jgi:hypothetical protein